MGQFIARFGASRQADGIYDSDRHIVRLEGEVAHLKPAASGNPSPARGMAMLRRGRAKSDLAKAKNKQASRSRPK
jgi:hypothetical protein